MHKLIVKFLQVKYKKKIYINAYFDLKSFDLEN